MLIGEPEAVHRDFDFIDLCSNMLQTLSGTNYMELHEPEHEEEETPLECRRYVPLAYIL